jgi:hypothetical protein
MKDLISFLQLFLDARLCCGQDPGYVLKVDGTTLQQGTDDDFGTETTFDFGSCGGGGGSGGGGGGGGGGGTPSCVDLKLDLRTDQYGDETEVWLINDETQEFIWYDWGFDSNQFEQFNACLDANGCAIFEIFDSWGDGISEPGGITLTFGGEVVYESGDFGYGEVFRFGDGC